MCKNFSHVYLKPHSDWHKRFSERSTEAYSQPCQASKIELLGKMVKGWKLLAIFAEICALDY